jgi:hypothetical protein
MKKPFFILSFFLFQFSNLLIAQNNVLTENLSKNLYKISMGSNYFYDNYIFKDKVIGFNVGLGYERTFARKWSWGIGLEGFFNKNAVPKVKMLYDKKDEIHLPRLEERYTFYQEIKHYFSKAGSGFYISNLTNLQWVHNGVLTSVYDCNSCPNLSNELYDSFAYSDRLSWGYQKFINQKVFWGFAVGYELRFSIYQKMVTSPQIAFQIGFNK